MSSIYLTEVKRESNNYAYDHSRDWIFRDKRLDLGLGLRVQDLGLRYIYIVYGIRLES